MSAQFMYQIALPRDAETSSRGTSLVLFHGTGGTESDLIPYGQRIAPYATLIGVRGRSLTEGSPRWFRRLTMTRFDQAHIHEEAHAFAEFLPGLFEAHRLDPAEATFVGYSNGANFITAVMFFFPNVIHRAILLRPMMVLDDPPVADLSGVSALLIAGEADPYRSYLPPLEDALRKGGATFITQTIMAGHELARADLTLAQDWLNAQIG